uniref:Transmembrane protein 101 n=1 Tax=Amphiprion percula TaxID=161767 RepID=A0A3P8SCC5_AMPPE
MAGPSRKEMLRFLSQLGAFILTRFGFWNCFCMLMLFAERADSKRKPDIHVPYLYVDMGAAVLCASFMSFGVKRRWFAMAAAVQLAVSTYASYIGEQVYYGDWLKVRMYSRAMAIIGGFLVLASGAGEVYRQKPRSRSMQSTGQVFLGVYLICMVQCQAIAPSQTDETKMQQAEDMRVWGGTEIDEERGKVRPPPTRAESRVDSSAIHLFTSVNFWLIFLVFSISIQLISCTRYIRFYFSYLFT